MDEKRVDENEWWVSFKISYGFRENKNLPIPKGKQDLRTFLWVSTPRVPLIPVAEAKRSSTTAEGLGSHPSVPFPQKPLMLRACMREAGEPTGFHLRETIWKQTCGTPALSQDSAIHHNATTFYKLRCPTSLGFSCWPCSIYS